MKPLVFAVLLAASPAVQAQFIRMVELKPISKRGFNYHYDLKRMRTPYALQLPLLQIEDDEVAMRYKRFENLDLLGEMLAFVPFIYLFSDLNPGGQAGFETFFLLVLGSLAGELVLTIVAHNQLRRGIDRYNQLLVTPSSALPGLSLRYRF